MQAYAGKLNSEIQNQTSAILMFDFVGFDMHTITAEKKMHFILCYPYQIFELYSSSP